MLTGRLRPGDRLDLDEITEEFGTSRTPVREALLELSYEGLVAVTPRSGITVVGITPEDAVDNFAVLAALTGKAAEWATSRITEPPVGRAAPSGRRRGRRPGRGRRQPAVPPRRQPGRRVPRLLTYLRQAVRVVPASYFDLFPEQERRSRAEHAALLDAIGRGDAPRRAHHRRGPRARRRCRVG